VIVDFGVLQLPRPEDQLKPLMPSLPKIEDQLKHEMLPLPKPED
jgi:hypothetical protein